MKPSEIKALRKAETIEQVAAMVDCRDHEYSREEQAAHVKTHPRFKRTASRRCP